MNYKYNAQALANKIYWEGGIYEALQYGISSEDIEEGELKEAWRELNDEFRKFEVFIRRVRKLLPRAE